MNSNIELSQEATMTGSGPPQMEMSGKDLVDQIQELAREIESIDDVSSATSDSQRLSPSVKPTVLWAKKRFPRQGIRSARRIGQQRKLGFGATTRLEVGQLPMRQDQINNHYPAPWLWTQNHEDGDRALVSPLSNAQASSKTRWPSSAASLSNESEYSIGTIAAPLDQESISDVEEEQRDPIQTDCPLAPAHNQEHRSLVTVTSQHRQQPAGKNISCHIEDNRSKSNPSELNAAGAEHTAVTKHENRTAKGKRANPHQEDDGKDSPQKSRKKAVSSGSIVLTEHWDHHAYTRKATPPDSRPRMSGASSRAKQILRGKDVDETQSGVSICTTLVVYKRRNTKRGNGDRPATSFRGRRHKDGNRQKRNDVTDGLCRSCRKPLEKTDSTVKWSENEWDSFWTKVSCAASDIRTLREHGLHDNEACVDFLRNFKDLITTPFL